MRHAYVAWMNENVAAAATTKRPRAPGHARPANAGAIPHGHGSWARARLSAQRDEDTPAALTDPQEVRHEHALAVARRERARDG